MRAAYVVGHRVYTPGLLDTHGNARAGHQPPVDLAVYAIAPTVSTEDNGDGRTAVSTGIQLLVPRGASIGPHDRFDVDGATWEVEGEVLDYTRGPFGFRPGVVVNLTRVEG